MISFGHKTRRALLVSASFPLSVISGAHVAHAEQTVMVDAPATTVDVNAAIASKIATPDPDLKITVTKDGVITGGGSVSLFPSTGKGDGAITFGNAGTIGAVDKAGAVTDTVNVQLNGAGAGNAKNVLTASNSGLITGSVFLYGFGGGATLDNSGTILGSAELQSYGDTALTSTGSIGADGAFAQASGTYASKSDKGTTTETYTSGAATVNVANVASADGKSRGAVTATSDENNASATVAGIAGAVNASSTDGGRTIVTTVATAEKGKAVTTYDSATSYKSDTAIAVTVTKDGDVDSATAYGYGNTAATIDGKVSGAVNANSYIAYNSTATSVTTLDDDGNLIGNSGSNSSTPVAYTSAVTVGETGAADSVGSHGIGGATVTIDGAVKNGVSAVATGATATTSSYADTFDGKGTQLTHSYASTNKSAGGAASVAVGANGSAESVYAAGDAGATSTIAGAIDGAVSLYSTGIQSTYNEDDVYDSGETTSFKSHSSTTPLAGKAALTVADTGAIGDVATLNGYGGVSASIAGEVKGSLNLTSSYTASTADNANTLDVKTGATTSNSSWTNTASGGSASVDIAATGIVGSIYASADDGVTVVNAGSMGGGVTAISSVYQHSAWSNAGTDSGLIVDDKAGMTTHSYTTDTTDHYDTVGGPISLTNSGVIGAEGTGVVSAMSAGDVTLVNTGIVRGTTSLTSHGTSTSNADHSETVEVLTKGVAPALDVTTTTTKTTHDYAYNVTGGSVSGTYAGTNGGINFSPTTPGSITQTADKASTVSIAGTVYGNVSSTAGTEEGSYTDARSTQTTQVVDTADNGTFSSASTESYKLLPGTGGDSKVTVTGTVDDNFGYANVSSSGANSSTVLLDGGKVDGSVSVTASGVFAGSYDDSESYDQTLKAGVTTTNNAAMTQNWSYAYSDGAASLDLKDKAKIGGSANVSGNSSATVTVADGSSVGGDLTVQAGNPDDITGKNSATFTRDPATGTYTAVQTSSYLSDPSATGGDATVTVAGDVAGHTGASAARGNASVVLTGTSAEGVSAYAGGLATNDVSTTSYAGKSTSASISPYGLAAAGDITKSESKTVSTNVGGKASITVDSAKALADTLTPATTGGLSADGLAGASITISGSSIVEGSVTAVSARQDSVDTSTTVYTKGSPDSQASTHDVTWVGGTAQIGNAGQIDGLVSVSSATSALIDNSGKISGEIYASALQLANSTTSVQSDMQDIVAHSQTTTSTPVISGGDAKVTNSGLIDGDISLAGKTGELVNNGIVSGTTYLGYPLDNYARTDVLTTKSTTTTITPATPYGQTYTVDQNGFSGGVTVGAATITDPTDSTKTILTSAIKATINLNDGSATLGNITAQVDPKTFAHLTDTTVNLNGSGFLGADEYTLVDKDMTDGEKLSGTYPTPYLVISKDASEAGLYPRAVSVTGVTAVNKNGAGTFVINGVDYVASKAPGLPATYSIEADSFNINQGEVQLWTQKSSSGTGEFGIKATTTNSGTLVIGRRVHAGIQTFGDSIVGVGPEYIAGTTLTQIGDFNQTASGTTVVALMPSLVRAGTTSVDSSSSGSELLAPVTGGVTRYYFTTPEHLYGEVSNSLVKVTGNLNLAGKIGIDVNRDSLFLDGDSETIFTYTGTANVTATVDASESSPFVDFSLVNDATDKTIDLKVTRTSYATAAANANAAAAATALDSALQGAVAAIRTDATGGAAFDTATQLGYAQDIANVATALDYRLSSAQAAELFDELSSGEIYGSLSAVDQNVIFGKTVDVLATRRGTGGTLGTGLWLNPVGNFARYGRGEAYGASEIKVDSYGAAFGFDIAYDANGAFGFGGAYGEHNVDARGSDESARVRTWTIGAYVTQGFGPIYVNGLLSYGMSRFTVDRSLALLSRSMESEFKGHQFDGSIEVGYDFATNGFVITPFAKLKVRQVSFDAATETGGGAFSLDVAQRSDSVASPILGLKVAGAFTPSSFEIRPYAKVSYTIQGDLASDRTVQFVGGGDSFVLKGVNPQDYATFEAGLETTVADRVNLFLSGGYSTGGGNEAGNLSAGIKFKF